MDRVRERDWLFNGLIEAENGYRLPKPRRDDECENGPAQGDDA